MNGQQWRDIRLCMHPIGPGTSGTDELTTHHLSLFHKSAPDEIFLKDLSSNNEDREKEDHEALYCSPGL